MATAGPLLHSTKIPTQLNFRSKATSQRSFDEPLSTTPHDDPLRILVPAQKKLSTIESQRVLSVLHKTSQRLNAALSIPSLASSIEHLSVSLGSDLVALLQEYKDATDEFLNLTDTLELTSTTCELDRSQSFCSIEDDSVSDVGEEESALYRTESNEKRLCKLQQQIRHIVKSTLRAVFTNPSVLEAVHKKKVTSHNHLMEGLQGLLSVSTEILLTTKMEEMKREDYMLMVAKRKLSTEESIRQLEAELEMAQKQKYEAVSEKKSQINQLRTNIKSVASFAQETTRKIRTEAKKQQTQAETAHSNAKTKIIEETAALKKQHQDIVAEDKEKEIETRKKTSKRELEVENWIRKYDEEMGEKQDELEMLQEQFTEEKQQLKELEEKLGILKLKYDSAIKEQEEARLKAEQEAEERKIKTKAAKLLQKNWRIYHARKMEAKLAQKGKKKGKGKGKGKNKKK